MSFWSMMVCFTRSGVFLNCFYEIKIKLMPHWTTIDCFSRKLTSIFFYSAYNIRGLREKQNQNQQFIFLQKVGRKKMNFRVTKQTNRITEVGRIILKKKNYFLRDLWAMKLSRNQNGLLWWRIDAKWWPSIIISSENEVVFFFPFEPFSLLKINIVKTHWIHY